MEGRQNLAGLLSLSVVPAGCLPFCQGAVCLSWMQKICQRVPTGAYCLQNWQSRHTKLSYIIECVKYHRFIECAKYHRFFS